MRDLNLLPIQEQHNLLLERARRATSFFGLWALLLCVIFGGLLIPAYFFIVFQSAEVERAERAELERFTALGLAGVKDEVRRLNQRLQFIVSREEKKRVVSPFLSQILSSAPEGVSVAFISVNQKEKRVAVSGTARTRALLLQFADRLKEHPFVGKVVTPLANIVKQENISFSIELEIKP